MDTLNDASESSWGISNLNLNDINLDTANEVPTNQYEDNTAVDSFCHNIWNSQRFNANSNNPDTAFDTAALSSFNDHALFKYENVQQSRQNHHNNNYIKNSDNNPNTNEASPDSAIYFKRPLSAPPYMLEENELPATLNFALHTAQNQVQNNRYDSYEGDVLSGLDQVSEFYSSFSKNPALAEDSYSSASAVPRPRTAVSFANEGFAQPSKFKPMPYQPYPPMIGQNDSNNKTSTNTEVVQPKPRRIGFAPRPALPQEFNPSRLPQQPQMASNTAIPSDPYESEAFRLQKMSFVDNTYTEQSIEQESLRKTKSLRFLPWSKSVADRIQEDFPRTPSPALSQLRTNKSNQQDSQPGLLDTRAGTKGWANSTNPGSFKKVHSTASFLNANNRRSAFESQSDLFNLDFEALDDYLKMAESNPKALGNLDPSFLERQAANLEAAAANLQYNQDYLQKNIDTSSVQDAADNLKNMSLQMAAFLNAHQQLYAAQIAQMTAINNGQVADSMGMKNGSRGMPSDRANDHTAILSSMFSNSTKLSGIPDNLLGKGVGSSSAQGPWDQLNPRGGDSRWLKHQSEFERYATPPPNAFSNRQNRHAHGANSGGARIRARSARGFEDPQIHERKNFGNPALQQHYDGAGDSFHSSRSPLLEIFRMTSSSLNRGLDVPPTMSTPSTREWTLSEIKGYVVEFATDQHGSRFIQQKLEVATPQEIGEILEEAISEAQRLMTDVFGNYVIQKLLDHGGKQAEDVISKKLRGQMLQLSLHMYGCRVVQKALEVFPRDVSSELISELSGHVLRCIRDQNGNHVIQKCIELVGSENVSFIVDAVMGQAVSLAEHSYGCRVVQRILEYGSEEQKAPIMTEIMASVRGLIKDQYGNYVIQHVVERGTTEERTAIIDLAREEVCNLSQHKFASNVVERCLQYGTLQQRQELIEILIEGDGPPSPSPLIQLVRHQFGNYVVQRVLDVAQPDQRERVAEILRLQVPILKRYSYGKHIIARLDPSWVKPPGTGTNIPGNLFR